MALPTFGVSYIHPGGQPPSTLKDVAGMPDVPAPSPHVFCLYPLYRPTLALCWAGARLSGVSLKSICYLQLGPPSQQ